MELLKTLCSIHAPSGQEEQMQKFLLEYIQTEQERWKVKPEIIHGEDFQNCIILVFGEPRTAVYAHIDSIGFHVRYGEQLVKIGSPRAATGYALTGHDSAGPIECELIVNEDDHEIRYRYHRLIDRGTALTFKPNYREDNHYVQCCYLDNRMGVYNALRLAETLEHGVLVFSCWEEHGGGSVPYIARYLWDRFKLRQALISDITWVTEGVKSGGGVAVSLRDSGLPRRVFTRKICDLLTAHQVNFQVEVENAGGSDGNELQRQPYPIDWCFIGAPEEFVHSPDEKVHKADLASMIEAYRILMRYL